jgi:hypothetical protein
MYLKWKLATLTEQQHNAPVSSNFCKELDSARFYQRAFFLPVGVNKLMVNFIENQ